MNTLKTSDWGRKFVERFEGLYLKAYNDGAGVPTIGYGHTTAAGPPSVSYGMTITREEADEYLSRDLGRVEKDVNDLVLVPLNQNQFDALVSFHFNTGALGKSTLLKKLNAGDYTSVTSELAKWTHAGGREMRGLVTRRREEGKLFNKPDFPEVRPEIPTVDAQDLAREITEAVVIILEKRNMAEIETAPSKPLVQSKTFWGILITALPTLITQLAPLFGFSISEDVTTQIVSAAVTIGGAIFAAYGRVAATKQIG